MSLASSIHPRRSNQQLWGGMPVAEPAGSSGDAGLLEDQKPVGSMWRLLCQDRNLRATTIKWVKFGTGLITTPP